MAPESHKSWICGRKLEGQEWLLIGIYTKKQYALDTCMDQSYFVSPMQTDHVYPGRPYEWDQTIWPKRSPEVSTDWCVIPLWDAHFDDVHEENVEYFEDRGAAEAYARSILKTNSYDDVLISFVGDGLPEAD